MTGCPLMEDTWEVNSKPCWKFLGCWRKSLGLDPIPLKQCWEQLCILHGNKIKFCSWSLLLWIELLRSLLSRLLLILWKLGLITRISNIIGVGHNSGNRVISLILLLRPTFHHTHFLVVLLGTVNGSTFFDQMSFTDSFFQTHTHCYYVCEVVGFPWNHILIKKLIQSLQENLGQLFLFQRWMNFCGKISPALCWNKMCLTINLKEFWW